MNLAYPQRKEEIAIKDVDKSKSNITYLEKVKIKFNHNMELFHPNIKHGEYIMAKQKLACECLICGYKWMSSPNNLISNKRTRGCPNCAKNVAKTDAEIRKLIQDKYENIVILSSNLKIDESILFYFLDENIFYKSTPKYILSSNNPKFIRFWDNDIYDNELKKINPNVKRIDDFVFMKTKIKHYCNIHKRCFFIDPTHALRGQGCSDCKEYKINKFTLSRRTTHEDYLKKLNNVNPYIYPIEKFQTVNDLLTHKCKKCNRTWVATPNNILRGTGCPFCSKSKGERKIEIYLEKHKINYQTQYRFNNCRNKKPLPFDFAVFDDNNSLLFLIEYQGEQHYHIPRFGSMSLSKNELEDRLKGIQQRDKIKYDFCKKNDIDLFQIIYTDFNNIDKILDAKIINK